MLDRLNAYLPAFSYILTLIPLFFSTARAQLNDQQIKYSTGNFFAGKFDVVYPDRRTDGWFPQLINIEMPDPSGEKARLKKIKEESRKRFPIKKKLNGLPAHIQSALPPAIINGFEANKYSNSIPNDNNLAVSNEGKLVSVSNTIIRAYDLIDDTLLFNKSLGIFSQSLGFSGWNNGKFDPKILYDPENDRFIFVFLNGDSPAYSKIILAFSSSGNPKDAWNLYYLSGNPLNDSTWSDYPAIAITKDELFITVNQIIPGLPWQTGFSQSLIWQVDKKGGFNGDTLLKAKLWKDIRFGNNPVRNLCPVGGGASIPGPGMFFLSNRNFAIQNDTIFLLEITGHQNDPSALLNISYSVADIPYGVPPSARQSPPHTFETNDGRVLGAFIENNQIQFVSNCIDTATGFAAVYHGIISDPGNPSIVNGNIIGDTVADFGYPNISYAGKQFCDNEAVISFNHTSPADYSGLSAIYYSNQGTYSPVIKVKEGENYVNTNVMPDSTERWGDYSGSQRKFNEPGMVWIVGSYGNSLKQNATWVAQLQSPDTNLMSVQISDSGYVSSYQFNDGYALVDASGGNEPYNYSWSNGGTGSSIANLQEGRYFITVTDAYNCAIVDSVDIMEPDPVEALFPNPVTDRVSVNFMLEGDETISVSVHDVRGRLIKFLGEDTAGKGRNIFSFYTQSLSKGTYFIKITGAGRKIIMEKFVKN